MNSLSPGLHTLNITATSSDGEVDTAFISFVVPDKLGETTSSYIHLHEHIIIEIAKCIDLICTSSGVSGSVSVINWMRPLEAVFIQ